MTGQEDLQYLLEHLQPVLSSERVVFCTSPHGTYDEFLLMNPIATIREEEGMTLLLREEVAQKSGLHYDGIFRCITLNVHSSLVAVGLTAKVTEKLTEYGISANVIAGFFHDHVFVPAQRAEEALMLLQSLSTTDE